MTVLLSGTGLTAVVTAVMYAVWGRSALLPGVVFGLLATGIQWAVHMFFRPVAQDPMPALMKRYGIGMGLRVAGVGLIAVAAAANPQGFPALPTGLGYLGVLIPLHFAELRFLR